MPDEPVLPEQPAPELRVRPVPPEPFGAVSSAPQPAADWRPPEPAEALIDPAAVSGPPWPRLVAPDPSYKPPRLIRWPIVAGMLLVAGWVVTSSVLAVSHQTSNTASQPAPYVMNAGDAFFTATFPGKPQRTQQSVGTTSVIVYTATLADHGILVSYLPVSAPGTFSLDGDINGVASAEPGGRVVSRQSLTYQGQTAEDGVISFTGGEEKVRVVVIGSAAYSLNAIGQSAASFAKDYQTLLDTFRSTSPPMSGSAAPPSAGHGSATATSAPAAPAPTLGAKLIRAPAGFSVVSDSSAHNGPVSAAEFDSSMAYSGAAAALHYVDGYQIAYGSDQTGDILSVDLFRFRTDSDAEAFLTGYVQGSNLKSSAFPALPGAQTYDGPLDTNGGYIHGVIASKGTTAMLVEFVTSAASRPASLDSLARQQYDKL